MPRSQPNGYLLATVINDQEEAYTEDDFFGVEMFRNNLGFNDYINLLCTTGFMILEQGLLGHGSTNSAAHSEEHHPLIFAQKASKIHNTTSHLSRSQSTMTSSKS